MTLRNPLVPPMPILRLGAASNRVEPRVTASNPIYSAQCRHPLKDNPCVWTQEEVDQFIAFGQKLGHPLFTGDDKSFETCKSKFSNIANFDFSKEPRIPPSNEESKT